MTMTRRRWIGLLIAVGLMATLAPTLVTIMARTPEPSFTLVKQDGGIEIREYAPMLVAEVETNGSREAAIGDGFRALADFIFGNNAPNQKIEMTAPVTQASGTKIEMTAPVLQENVLQETMSQQGVDGPWRVRFVMPAAFTLETLPKPNNANVKIIAEPGKKFAVIRFSGRTTDQNLKAAQSQLETYVASNALKTKGPAVFAFYNPPWTIPLFKRTEVMVELSQ
jgi:effector-binding domain-containing protein